MIRLLKWIGIAILVFWLLGVVLKLAGWLLNVALTVGLILVIIALISNFATRGNGQKD